MAIIGTTFAETVSFFSSYDEAPDAEKTEFLIGAIDGSVRGMIGDNAISWLQTENGTQMVNKNSQREYELCRFGLKGWNRFADERGNQIEYKTGMRVVNGKPYTVVDDDALNKIPQPVISEIASKVLEINLATDTLRKK